MKRLLFVIVTILLLINQLALADGEIGQVIIKYLDRKINPTHYAAYFYIINTDWQEVFYGLDERDHIFDYGDIEGFGLPISYVLSIVEGERLVVDRRPYQLVFYSWMLEVRLDGDFTDSWSFPVLWLEFHDTCAFGDMQVYIYCKEFFYNDLVCLTDVKYPGSDVYIRMKNRIGNQNYTNETIATIHFYMYENKDTMEMFLCDVDRNGVVDLGDFRQVAKDWLKPEGKYRTDITGPNSIPDGIVDELDFIRFFESWRFDSIDLNNDGAVDLLDYAIIADSWKAGGCGDFTGQSKLPDGIIDFRDLNVLAKRF